MRYALEITPSCKESIAKLCKKNPIIEQALQRKLDHILESPYHFKPLRHDLAGERRVHIMKSFVLKYEVNESVKTVVLLFFGHHDDAYGR